MRHILQTMSTEKIYLRLSLNSEALTSDFLENLALVFPLYWCMS